MNRKKSAKFYISRMITPETMLVGGFALLILIGAILLATPWASGPNKLPFIDALFTSTSAVCVTGLTVVDTGLAFSFFGQVLIVVLIQSGGLGIMTFAAIAFQMFGLRMSLKSQAVLHDTLFQKDLASQFQRAFKTIIAHARNRGLWDPPVDLFSFPNNGVGTSPFFSDLSLYIRFLQCRFFVTFR